MILRKKIESIFYDKILQDSPNLDLKKGLDVKELEELPYHIIDCQMVSENEDFPPRAGSFNAELRFIIEDNINNESYESYGNKIAGITCSIEDLTEIQNICSESYPEIHIHDVWPAGNDSERDNYNIYNTYNYSLVFEHLNV